MDRPPSILTSPEPDRPFLSRVKRNESDIVAHVWHTHSDHDAAALAARVVRKALPSVGCPSCGRKKTAFIVDMEPVEVKVKGATARLFVVVIRHLREGL